MTNHSSTFQEFEDSLLLVAKAANSVRNVRYLQPNVIPFQRYTTADGVHQMYQISSQNVTGVWLVGLFSFTALLHFVSLTRVKVPIVECEPSLNLRSGRQNDESLKC